MTNEQFEYLIKIASSNNFDDVLLAVEIMKNQFYSDINDREFRVPKRYYFILDLIQNNSAIVVRHFKQPSSYYKRLLQLICSDNFELRRSTFNLIMQLNSYNK